MKIGDRVIARTPANVEKRGTITAYAPDDCLAVKFDGDQTIWVLPKKYLKPDPNIPKEPPNPE